MALTRFTGFASHDAVALFKEASASGVQTNWWSVRNSPIRVPGSNLSNVYFHSDFDYYELARPKATITVSHTSVPVYISPDIGIPGLVIKLTGQTRLNDIPIFTHGLGYVPRYMVAFGGAVLTNGTLVQDVGTDGRTRIISAFADANKIYLRELARSTATALPAVSKTYEVMVFKHPTKDPSKPLFSFDGSVVQIGRGAVSSDKNYLRRVLPAESSFDIDRGPTMDIANGSIRVVSGGNVYSEPHYTGSFVGPAFIPVGGVV